MVLSDLERRVLGHLPAWTADEDAFVALELEAGAVSSVRSYDVAELMARLAGDAHTPAMAQDALAAVLGRLAAGRLASGEEGRWRMTEAGYGLLTGPAEEDGSETRRLSALLLNGAQSLGGGEA